MIDGFLYGLGMKSYEQGKGMIEVFTISHHADRTDFIQGYLNAWCFDCYHANGNAAILPSQFMVGYQVGFFKPDEIDQSFVQDQGPDPENPLFDLGKKTGALDRYRGEIRASEQVAKR